MDFVFQVAVIATGFQMEIDKFMDNKAIDKVMGMIDRYITSEREKACERTYYCNVVLLGFL